jgi:hypothetical protein
MQMLGGLSGAFWSMLKLLVELSELVLVLGSWTRDLGGREMCVSISSFLFTETFRLDKFVAGLQLY